MDSTIDSTVWKRITGLRNDGVSRYVPHCSISFLGRFLFWRRHVGVCRGSSSFLCKRRRKKGKRKKDLFFLFESIDAQMTDDLESCRPFLFFLDEKKKKKEGAEKWSNDHRQYNLKEQPIAGWYEFSPLVAPSCSSFIQAASVSLCVALLYG